MPLASGGAKQKGSSGERELADLLALWGREVGINLNIERNLEQVRHGGADLTGIPNMEVEVKRVENGSINNWWRQVCAVSQKTGRWPLLAHRQNRKPWRFRTYVLAAIYDMHGQGITVPIVVDMELVSAKSWFQAFIQQHKDMIT